MAQLQANLPNFLTQWPNDATLCLINERRAFQQLFSTSSRNDHRRYWRRIADAINAVHPNYQVNRKHWRTKSNTLKFDFES